MLCAYGVGIITRYHPSQTGVVGAALTIGIKHLQVIPTGKSARFASTNGRLGLHTQRNVLVAVARRGIMGTGG